jgi:hypothetical protein
VDSRGCQDTSVNSRVVHDRYWVTCHGMQGSSLREIFLFAQDLLLTPQSCPPARGLLHLSSLLTLCLWL